VAGGVESPALAPIKLRIVQPARVSGTLRTEDRKQLISAAMIMRPIDTDESGTWPARDVRILPNGTFSFNNVPPGRYLIRGRAETEVEGTSQFAAFIVTVAG